MKTSVFQAILDKLNDDATIQSYIGTNKVYRARRLAAADCPCITLLENNEKSKPRVGYVTWKTRDNSPTLQVDIWVSGSDESFPCTGEDADTIANRVDELLLGATPVTGTHSWEKTSSSQQFEDDTRIWHNALRFSFQYQITDS